MSNLCVTDSGICQLLLMPLAHLQVLNEAVGLLEMHVIMKRSCACLNAYEMHKYANYKQLTNPVGSMVYSMCKWLALPL